MPLKKFTSQFLPNLYENNPLIKRYFFISKARLHFEVCICSEGKNNLRGWGKIGPFYDVNRSIYSSVL